MADTLDSAAAALDLDDLESGDTLDSAAAVEPGAPMDSGVVASLPDGEGAIGDDGAGNGTHEVSEPIDDMAGFTPVELSAVIEGEVGAYALLCGLVTHNGKRWVFCDSQVKSYMADLLASCLRDQQAAEAGSETVMLVDKGKRLDFNQQRVVDVLRGLVKQHLRLWIQRNAPYGPNESVAEALPESVEVVVLQGTISRCTARGYLVTTSDGSFFVKTPDSRDVPSGTLLIQDASVSIQPTGASVAKREKPEAVFVFPKKEEE